MPTQIKDISAEQPVLIAGPTASGKSALALEIAARQGGVIVNADALQVYSDWRVLTARPSPEDEAQATHRLYGHVSGSHPYSAGQWLREVRQFLSGPERPIIVGGTGLNFTALTEGLVDIPPTAPDIRQTAMVRIGAGDLQHLIAELDAETRSRIDLANPMRVQRAWEVLQSTGRGLASWQDETPAPDLPLSLAYPILFDCDKHWLNARIERRFNIMLEAGALDEARENEPSWDPSAPSAKAIGAAELIAHIRGQMGLDEAREASIIATRQYAKRQRSWFRARMKNWNTTAGG